MPMLLAVQGLLIAALTLIAASAVPFLPDLKLVLQNLLRLWFFLSGVFYDISDFPDPLSSLLRLNPMALLLDGYRQILLQNRWPALMPLLVITLGSSLLLSAGLLGLRRFDRTYPKLRF